jgi:transposase-like protein
VDTDSVGFTACGEELGMGAQQDRRKFTSEFKDEAVRLVNDSGRPPR